MIWIPSSLNSRQGTPSSKIARLRDGGKSYEIHRRTTAAPPPAGRTPHVAPMRKPFMRVPYTDIFPPSVTFPSTANTLPGAVAALKEFLLHNPRSSSGGGDEPAPAAAAPSTLILTGAGVSVASGLADYRGAKGTYRLNRTYRPTFYHEFLDSHEARKRYWARSFLGWPGTASASPNAGHFAIRDLGPPGPRGHKDAGAGLGIVSDVVTQNVDSLHTRSHPLIPTVELHGYLRSTVCVSCGDKYPRDKFQQELARLNPRWATFLAEAVAKGALASGDPREREARGSRANPDGDVDVPGAPYTTFRYPACPQCLADSSHGRKGTVEVDDDRAWVPPSTKGILKPGVVMFGESIRPDVKEAAESAVDRAGKLLVLGTSLATASAWRLVKRAKDQGMPIGIVTIGGIRDEELLVKGLDPAQTGAKGVRIDMSTDELLPALVEELSR